MGKPESAIKKKDQKKSPVSKAWLSKLLFCLSPFAMHQMVLLNSLHGSYGSSAAMRLKVLFLIMSIKLSFQSCH